MFNNKKDPLVDAVKSIMEASAREREIERKLNESLGITSKKALPHELHKEYDTVLKESIAGSQINEVSEKLLKRAKQKAKDKAMVAWELNDKKAEDKNEKRAEKFSKAIAKKQKMKEALDPVGEEDGDVDNDGEKNTESDEYLKHRREVISKKMDEEHLQEKAPPGKKYERMVKHIKKGYEKDGLTKKEKSIAYATAWKAKNKEKMDESNSFNLVQEEIRTNLLERIRHIYENEGVDAANAYFETLSEEERGILGSIGRGALNIAKDMSGYNDLQQGNYGTAALKAATTFIPGGLALKGGLAALKVGKAAYGATRATQATQAAKASSEVAKAGEAVSRAKETATAWQKQGLNLGRSGVTKAETALNAAQNAQKSVTGISAGVGNIGAGVSATTNAVRRGISSNPVKATALGLGATSAAVKNIEPPSTVGDRVNPAQTKRVSPVTATKHPDTEAAIQADRAERARKDANTQNPHIADRTISNPKSIPAQSDREGDQTSTAPAPAPAASTAPAAPAAPAAPKPTAAASSVGQELSNIGSSVRSTSDTEAGRRKLEVLNRRKPEPDAFQRATRGDWSGISGGGA